MDLPDINKRIRFLIDKHASGRINRFADMCGMSSAYKLNRLFLEDKRSGKVPVASIDIVLDIANTFKIDMNWLLLGLETNETDTLVNEAETKYENGSLNSAIKKLQKNQDLLLEQNKQILEKVTHIDTKQDIKLEEIGDTIDKLSIIEKLNDEILKTKKG